MDLLDDDLEQPESRLAGYRTPEVLGLAALVLGIAAVLGSGLLSGQVLLSLAEGNEPPSTALQALAALLSAALAAVPLLLGLEATRLLLDDDPLWVTAVARAAVVLGAVAVVLRLGHVLVRALSNNPYYLGF